MDSSVLSKEEIWYLRVRHPISHAVYPSIEVIALLKALFKDDK
jgi:hypothetical protein